MNLLWTAALTAVTPAALLFLRSFPQIIGLPWMVPHPLDRSLPMWLFLRFMGLLHDLGGATLFPLSLLLLGDRKAFSDWVLLAAMAAVSALFGAFLYFKWDYAPLRALASVGMLTAAQAGIEHLVIRPLRRSPADRRLVLGFLAVFGVCLFSPWPAGARILPAVPLWVLLYLRRIERSPGRRWLPATAVVTLALAIGVFFR